MLPRFMQSAFERDLTESSKTQGKEKAKDFAISLSIVGGD